MSEYYVNNNNLMCFYTKVILYGSYSFEDGVFETLVISGSHASKEDMFQEYRLQFSRQK